MKNFDQFVGVDWSGAKSPINTKSIAVAVCEQGASAPVLLPDLRSRTAVAEWIGGLVGKDKRTLIGIDCNFGYARSVVQKQLGAKATAHDLWVEVARVNQDQPNFFAGNFWTDNQYAPYFWTEGKMPESFQMPKRQTEITCADNGYGRPESPFKLIGAKQVGKGGLAGMRMAHYLKAQLGDDLAIWPFENADNAKIVMSEIYPRQFLMRVGHGTTKVRDVETLNDILPFFKSKKINNDVSITDHDTDALVSAAGLRYLCAMNKDIPLNISKPPSLNDDARQVEGWIFGVGDQA